jgi:hypothetical protein
MKGIYLALAVLGMVKPHNQLVSLELIGAASFVEVTSGEIGTITSARTLCVVVCWIKLGTVKIASSN